MSPNAAGDHGVTRSSLLGLWAAFTGVVTVASIAIPLVATDMDSTVPAVLPAVLALSVGVAALVGMVALDRTLMATPPADDAAAAIELRARLVIQAAIAEAPVLIAAAMAFVLGPPWIVLAAAIPVLAGMGLVYPGPRRLARLDTAWAAAGADVSVGRALSDPDQAEEAP